MPESVTFSRSLYRPDAVQATAEAYSALARIEVGVAGDAIVVTLHDTDPDVSADLVDAFCNHALHETIIRHRLDLGGDL